MMDFRKKDFIIYSIAIMLVAAGYFNYLNFDNKTVQTSTNVTQNEINEEAKEENIGDAVLVNNNEVIEDIPNDEEEENQDEEKIENKIDKNYYAETKLERNKMYAEMISKYNEIISNSNSSEVQKNIATNEITKINNTKNAIMICENIILTKEFENCVILVNEESVNIVVHTEDGLNTEKVSQIQNIISRELGAEIENIHISEN